MLAPAGHSVIVAIGDSITDGDGQNGEPDADNRYPDYLAERLLEKEESLSIVNLGISGNRILEDGLIPNMGRSLLTRLSEDVSARDDVSNVIVLEGINDLGIGSGVTAGDIIGGLEEAVEILKTPRNGLPPIKVFVGTILPAGGTVDPIGVLYRETESRRQEVNDYIRTTGIGDGYVDFDEAVRDQSNEALLAADYDSGDGLHPSSEGYRQMADKVNLSELQNWDCTN